MIPVVEQPCPDGFRTTVEEPGAWILLELVGRPSGRTRGRAREQVAERVEDLEPDQLPPLWRDGSADLLDAYDHLCAYSAMYIHPVTGAATTDHFVPKSRSPQDAYRWRNYRVACALMNSRKRDFEDVLDPFEITDDTFELDLDTFLVRPGPGPSERREQEALATIRRLGLNDDPLVESRAQYVQLWRERHLDDALLLRWAPFVHRELARAGELFGAP